MKEQKTADEWKFTNQNWKKVLNEISNYAPNRYGRGMKYDEDHPLAKHLKITAYELTMIMAFLEEQSLIEYDKSEHNWIHLTSKGFDVALQNQGAKKADNFNKVTLFLGLAVAIFAVVTLLVGIQSTFQKWAVSGLIVVALIIGGYVVRRMYP